MSALQFVLAAILLLGPLVAIHEFGHFWVARRLGVKVLVYSIGFGPALWQRRGRDGVQYQIAAIPLGGYVRMADEREGEVAEADLPYAFNRQSVWTRMAIVAAGPLINLLFAILLFWLLLLPPSEQLNTRVASIAPASIAAQAGLQQGDKILAIDGRATPTWEQVSYALVDRMGESGQIAVQVARDQQQLTLNLPIQRFLREQQDPLGVLGFRPWQPVLPAVIGTVDPNGAAARYQLRVGDRIVAVDRQPINDWLQLSTLIRQRPEQLMTLRVQRGAEQFDLQVMPQGKTDAMGKRFGQLGVAVAMPATGVQAPAEYRQTIALGVGEALQRATVKTWDLSVMTVAAFGKMLGGLIGLDNLSGPITIAKMASHSAELGWMAFLSLMALMSVSLGVLNLLPIPVLDGGHLLYYALEAVRGRPISERVQAAGFRVGILMLGALMMLALFNDFSRLG